MFLFNVAAGYGFGARREYAHAQWRTHTDAMVHTIAKRVCVPTAALIKDDDDDDMTKLAKEKIKRKQKMTKR